MLTLFRKSYPVREDMRHQLDSSAEPVRIQRHAPVHFGGDANAWRDRLAEVFVELEFAQANPRDRLSALVYEYEFGDLTFIRTVVEGGKHRVIRSKALISKSPHNNFFIGCLLSGETTMAQSDRKAVLAKGDLAILDSTREYVVDAQQGFEALFVRVPRHCIEGRLAHYSRLMAERIDGSKGVGRLASVMLRSALGEAQRIVATDANRITNAILDLISISLSSRVPRPKPFSRSGQFTLRKIQQYIEEHLDNEDLTLRSLARANLVSARYVNRLFMREGVSAARWIRMRRLERCRADLEDPEKRHLSISEIAFNHGFRNISSFNRAFKARFHITPTALRII
jgi:AraC family transcriptional regulator, positive regulator of tynA and feaB